MKLSLGGKTYILLPDEIACTSGIKEGLEIGRAKFILALRLVVLGPLK